MEISTVIDKQKRPTISILIPCYNEEKMVKWCVLSCLYQSVTPEQIIFVDDCSKDGTPEVLARFTDRITVIRTPKNTGNKSSAQEFGLRHVTSDIVVTTDADTILDHRFLEEIVRGFTGPEVGAVGGYVSSMRHNWLTACRAFEYTIGQNIHKLAQSYMNFMFVIPGAAGAFRTDIFRKYLTFDHDTITEDLDFTYKLHKNGFNIKYTRDAIVYTQDPATLYGYINQIRRWIGGGCQNLVKHFEMKMKPAQALELSLIYVEGLVFSALLFVVPIFNLKFTLVFVLFYFIAAVILSIYAALREQRTDVLWAPIPSIMLMYINAYIFIEQFFKEVVFRRKNLVWFKPDRI